MTKKNKQRGGITADNTTNTLRLFFEDKNVLIPRYRFRLWWNLDKTGGRGIEKYFKYIEDTLGRTLTYTDKYNEPNRERSLYSYYYNPNDNDNNYVPPKPSKPTDQESVPLQHGKLPNKMRWLPGEHSSSSSSSYSYESDDDYSDESDDVVSVSYSGCILINKESLKQHFPYIKYEDIDTYDKFTKIICKNLSLNLEHQRELKHRQSSFINFLKDYLSFMNNTMYSDKVRDLIIEHVSKKMYKYPFAKYSKEEIGKLTIEELKVYRREIIFIAHDVLDELMNKSKYIKQGGTKKKTRKHRGIVQTGKNKGKLKKGYKYSGKRTKTGLPIIKNVKKVNK